MTASRPEGAKDLRRRVQALQVLACPHVRPEYFGVTLTDGCCIIALIVEYAREQVEAARKAFPESAWEAIFAEHERDHQHADASRLGCNGCAMLAYTESLRAQLQTLRGEHERLAGYNRLCDCGSGMMVRSCSLCVQRAINASPEVATLTQEKAALEARELALREALEKIRMATGKPSTMAQPATLDGIFGLADAALAPRRGPDD